MLRGTTMQFKEKKIATKFARNKKSCVNKINHYKNQVEQVYLATVLQHYVD